MALEFQVSTGSGVPIYRQIVDQVRRAVSVGDLVAGEQLPSVRALAEHLVVNPNTVARAYGTLTQEGVIDSQAGKGVFVAARRQMLSAEERERRLEVALEVFINEVLFLDFSPEEIFEYLKRKLHTLRGPSLAAETLGKELK